MWLALLSISSLALLGIVVGGFLFVIQKAHWIPCEQDVMSGDMHCQVESYAAQMGGKFKRCDIYWIENEPLVRRAKRRANYRIGIAVGKHRTIWSYWTLAKDGSMHPESPMAFQIAQPLRLAS
jgi:hypothetical protein